MNLFRDLLIDIIYYVRFRNLYTQEYTSSLGPMDRQNLTENYQIAKSLIDVIFEVLQMDAIEFDSNLRYREDFQEAKQQILALEFTGSSQPNPTITKKEGKVTGNPLISKIIKDQQLAQQAEEKLYHPPQTILFIHLIILCFPELHQNISIISKRRLVLLKLFGEQTYRYQRSKPLLQTNYNHAFQTPIQTSNLTFNKKIVRENQTESLRSQSQDAQHIDKSVQNIQFLIELKQGRKKQHTSLDLKLKSRFCFDSNCPIEIEQLSSSNIKMTFRTAIQFVYRWAQLDYHSYIQLRTNDTKAFNCWTSMLKLLDQKIFQQFIDGQVQDTESDNDGVTSIKQISQQLMGTDISLDQIVQIDNRQSIVKILNKVIIIDQYKLDHTLQSIQQQIEIVDTLVMRRTYIDNQIEWIRKQFHINANLEQWQQQLKAQKQRTIWNYSLQATNSYNEQSQSIKDSLNQRVLETQEDVKIEFVANEVQKIDTVLHEPSNLQLDALGEAVQIQFNQTVDQMYQCKQQLIPNTLPQMYIEGQHKGQWIFNESYPIKIEILSQKRLLMIVKTSNIIVEWWQFDYESLKNLVVKKVNMQAAQIWSILLMLVDSDQFFKLWKGEVFEQVSYINRQFEETSDKQPLHEQSNSLPDLPQTIIQLDQFRLILQFKTYVKISTFVEFEQFKRDVQISEFEANKWNIQHKQSFYTRQIKLFKNRQLQEQLVGITLRKVSTIPTQQVNKQQSGDELPAIKNNIETIQIHKHRWYFETEYPVRIDVVGKDKLKVQFKNKIIKTIVQWQQFDYKSLARLINRKVNIQAGEAWSVMLILLDHEQFYKLWKGDYQDNNNIQFETEIQDQHVHQVNYNQEQTVSSKEKDKRVSPDYIPEKIVRLDRRRFLIKFQNYIEILTDREYSRYKIVNDITDPELTNLKLHFRTSLFNQNIKAFQERLKLEKNQAEQRFNRKNQFQQLKRYDKAERDYFNDDEMSHSDSKAMLDPDNDSECQDVPLKNNIEK